jgi:hypothetical protein
VLTFFRMNVLVIFFGCLRFDEFDESVCVGVYGQSNRNLQFSRLINQSWLLIMYRVLPSANLLILPVLQM